MWTVALNQSKGECYMTQEYRFVITVTLPEGTTTEFADDYRNGISCLLRDADVELTERLVNQPEWANLDAPAFTHLEGDQL
jgi:hypothetical protein